MPSCHRRYLQHNNECRTGSLASRGTLRKSLRSLQFTGLGSRRSGDEIVGNIEHHMGGHISEFDSILGRDKLKSKNHRQNNDEQNRRAFLARTALSISFGVSTGIFGASANRIGEFSSVANARGLIRFPCEDPLLNTYHFMRAGSSLLEVEDVWSTNPLFL